MNILIISGSARKESLTKRIGLLLHKTLQFRFPGNTYTFVNAQDWKTLPFVESKYGTMEQVPDSEKPLAASFFHADGFILVSPEYNGSYAPALKNILDRFTVYHHKAIGIAVGSPGKLGGLRAAGQMQQLVNGLGGIGIPQFLTVPEVNVKIDENGELLDDTIQGSVDTFATEYMWLAKRLFEN